MGQKRRRELLAVDTRLVEIYDDLANVDQSIRLKAAHALLTKFVPDADAEQLRQILRRLIRGLCSGRKAARLGFSIALTEFLSLLLGPDASGPTRFQDVAGVVDTLIDQTKVGGGVDGQEHRDHFIGRLFGAEAIIKSGILFQLKISDEVRERVLDVIYEVAKKKSWLREQCGFVLHQSVETNSKLKLSFAQSVIDKLLSNGLAKTPEGIAIWIAVQSNFPSVELPSGVWQANSPLDRREKSKLALVLKEASVSDLDNANLDAKASQRGSWSASIHFAWLVVITELLSQSDNIGAANTSKRLEFQDFWNDCVEDGLFKSTSSDERKYWGLVLFQKVLSMASGVEIISSLFSFKLMQCFTNHLASTERFLHRAAEKARKTMVDRAHTSIECKLRILEALLLNGFVDFDKVSKTKTMEELLSGLDEASTPLICQLYDAVLLRPGTDDNKIAAYRRQIAAGQLLTAVKSMQRMPGQESSENNIHQLLSLLARFAYFEVRTSSDGNESNADPEISTASRDMFKARLSSCLTYLAATSDRSYLFAYHLAQVISMGQSHPDGAKLLLQADDPIQDVLDRTIDTMRYILQKLDNMELTDDKLYKAAMLLMSLTFLQVYHGNHDAVSMLDELNETFSKKQLKIHTKKGFESSTALVDILLSLVGNPSKLFRRLAQQVFDACASDVNEAGLERMLKILEVKENLDGQEALFDKIDDEEQQDGEELDSNASEGKMSDMEIVQGDQDSDDDDAATPSSNNSEDNEEDGSDEELAAFDAKLAMALGTRPGNADLDAEDSDSSDEDMNDEEMEALDKHLENVFREKKKIASKVVEKKDAKKTIIDFKCRVLELLEIFIKKQHERPLALLLILPLLTLLRTTSSPQVSQKASDLLRDYSRLCKGKELPHIKSTEYLLQLLGVVHEESLIDGSKAHAGACGQASLLLVRTIAGHDKESLRKVVKIYATTFATAHEKALSDKNARIKTSLFMDFSNWVSSSGK